MYVTEIIPPVKTAVAAFETQNMTDMENSDSKENIDIVPLCGKIQRIIFEVQHQFLMILEFLF